MTELTFNPATHPADDKWIQIEIHNESGLLARLSVLTEIHESEMIFNPQAACLGAFKLASLLSEGCWILWQYE
jgi:hypothetical protein